MRLPTRTVSRSYSGGGYPSGVGSSDESDTAAAEALLALSTSSAHGREQRRNNNNNNNGAKTKRSKRRSNKHAIHGGLANTQGSRLLLIFLGSGLVFCILDIVYIWKYVLSQNNGIGMSSPDDHNIASEQGSRSSSSSRHRQIQTLATDWDTTASDGEDPIVTLLKEAQGPHVPFDPALAQRLPTVDTVAALYGRQPHVLGLETCEAFRTTGDPTDHVLAVAGTFNTGTNLLAELLIANCVLSQRQTAGKGGGVRWQVLWGKHTPVADEAFRVQHRVYNDTSLSPENMFTATMVRDPYKWMQSMCRHSYGAQWPHDVGHCPNLIPNSVDKTLGKTDMQSPVNVSIEYAEFTQHHDSLVGFWNDWNLAYADAPFPRLMVRFEDLVFHPKTVTTQVCECAGGTIKKNRKFKYIVDSAKKGAAHGKEKTSYVDALIKYGTEDGRYTGMDAADMEFAVQHLDQDLMRLFAYKNPST